MENKRCSKCREVKPLAEFYAAPAGAGGRRGDCKDCYRDRHRRTRAARLYGLPPDEWDALRREQDGRCAICRDPLEMFKRTHVDHCHATGRVRGLLCHHCNRGLGCARDSPALLRLMAAYLEAGSAAGPS